MKFAAPLLRGTLVRRYKRFLADVVLETGGCVTAHCPNSGSMLSVATPGSEVWLSRAAAAKRKYPLTWELIRIGGALVGINTARPNALVAEAVAEGVIGELDGYETVRREVPYGRNSRIDLLFEAANRPKCFVEVKNVTLKRDLAGAMVEFPDCVTRTRDQAFGRTCRRGRRRRQGGDGIPRPARRRPRVRDRRGYRPALRARPGPGGGGGRRDAVLSLRCRA